MKPKPRKAREWTLFLPGESYGHPMRVRVTDSKQIADIWRVGFKPLKNIIKVREVLPRRKK